MVDCNNVHICLIPIHILGNMTSKPIHLAKEILAKSLVQLLNVIIIHWINCPEYLVELLIRVIHIL